MALNRDGDYVPIDAVAGIAHVGAGALLGGAGGSFAERVDVVGRTDWRKWRKKGGEGYRRGWTSGANMQAGARVGRGEVVVTT